MDVSVNPVLESVRPFFQGLPAPAGAPPTTSAGSTASLPSQPGAATPVQPQHGFPTASAPSTSPSALAYWQRPKDSAKSPALASPLHHVYNGKLGEPLQPSAHQPAPEQQRHNLPPIAALSTYPHARSVLREAQGSPHHPLPSISQITPHTKSSTPSLSPRTTHQDQFRTPEYPQSNHHSIYSPNPSSNQSHSRSSSYQSQSQPQTQGSKYHSAPSSPASSSPSPHAYSYSPRTTLPTTTSSPVYNQTTSTSSHAQRQPQSRPPSNPTHHPMSPVIQQPNQPDHALLKVHQQPPTQYPQHQLPAHSPYSSSQQHSSSHSSHSHQQALYLSHQSQQHSSSQGHLIPSQHQQHSQLQKQQPNNLHQQPSVLHHHSSSHQQHSSSPQQLSSSHSLHSTSSQQNTAGPQHHSSSHQQLSISPQQHSSGQQLHASAHQQLSSSSQQHLSTLQHHSSSLQQLSSNIHQHSSSLQQLSSAQQHSSNIQQLSNVQQKSSILQQKAQYVQHSSGHHSSQTHQSSSSRHQPQSLSQHTTSQLAQHSSSQQPQQGFAQYKTQQQQGQRHEQTAAARSQHLLTQQQHQLQQQTNLYNQSVQQSEADQLTEMLRIKERQLAVAQAQQQAYYAAASSSSSTRPSSRPTTIEANNQHQTTTTQALTARVKRESPLDLSVKTVRQSADSTAKDDSESLYHVNFQIQEASFQHRSKLPVKTASPRSSTLLPSLQLPSTVVYPHFDHPSNQTASSGAPKLDFLPNFQAHHGPSAGKSANFQDPGKRHTKASISQQPSPQYPSHLASLPHMASFKKSSLPSASYDDANKQSQYYPTTSLTNTHRPSSLTNHSSLNVQSSHAAAPNSHYPFDSSKRGSSARYDFMERRNSSSSSHSSISSESNFYLGKRQSSSDLKHPLPPKVPRVVDTWRQTIDQQIEQRLNSYASSRGRQVNGATKESSSKSDISLHQQNILPLSSSSSSNNIQLSHERITLQPSNLSSQSLHSSNPPNSSSKFDLSSQYFPHNQLQYQSHNLPPRSSSHELYNNLAQVKIPNLPNNGAADKRVLSILRKRLDTREATNHMIQQQNEATHNQERSKMYSRIYPQSMIVPSPILASQCKPPAPVPIARHNLPPFNALNLERSATMPYPTQKLHIPKAMDSVPPEHAQSNFMPRNDLVPRSPLPSQTEAAGKPGSMEGDCDGLTAYLAARIRTKGELKQVGPSVEQQPTPTLASESNSSAQSPRTTPGIFSPPPSLNSGYSYPAVPGDFSKGTPTSESDRASSSGHSNSSPMKSFRDRYSTNSPRRKLFCRPEDEQSSTPSEGVIQARERGLRSSSETSVFDFRESDSDGETASERQSLHEMRKDRDRRLQEKHQNVPASSLDPTSDLIQINDTEPIDDSFWSGMCDQFVHQLQKGGMKVRKKGKQRKWKYIPIELEDPDPEWECNAVPEPPSTILVSEKENIKLGKDTEVICKTENTRDEPLVPVPVIEKDTIKVEAQEEQKSIENPVLDSAVHCKEEKIVTLKETITKEEESSDEDVPLSLRQTELKKEKEASSKVDESSYEIDGKIMLKSECSKTFVKLEKLSKEDIKKGLSKQEPKPKIEASDSEPDTSADESTEAVAKRLRVRKPKEDTSKTKRKTKPKEKENSFTPTKGGRKKKGEKKKSVFGDGTEFRPGWEAEVYRYKRSLRMPARLINIAGPQNWPRLSVSLPDLDPDSPMTLDSDLSSLQNKQFDSDYESTPTKTKSKDRKNKTPQKKVEEKGEEDSFINRLIQRYGGKGKKSLRKAQEKDCSKDKKGPKIIPQTNELKLLPTPSLDCIVKTPTKRSEQNTSQSKHAKGKKGSKLGEPVDLESKDGVFLGYFRKQTVSEFRDAFAKHNGGFATEHELPPIMLKSRTRTQTRILTQRATIREVFGEDRPASAPPAGCREEENDNAVSNGKKPKKLDGKNKKLLNKLGNNNGLPVGTRTGLRSAAVLRSNKAVLKSKQQLLHGEERRKRDKDLIKSYKSVKKFKKDDDIAVESEIKVENQEDLNKLDGENPVLTSEKRLKYKSVRRKLKSSGFDYIRKKKKQQQKKEGDIDSIKDKKKATPPKPVLESEEDIQNEIKGWVINKGLGETVLHRAARLGYTDIAAYCLEKLEHNASPRDNAGYTPLHEACSKGRLDIARLLLQYGADPSDSAQGGIRPLHEASEHGCLEMIRLLLSYGADPLLATYSGHTPLSLASHHPEAKALLQNHLADVQGLPCVPWPIQELIDPALLGNDPMADAPSPDPADVEVEIECGELSLPNLYQLLGEPLTDRWVLFQELGPILRVKTRDALIKQLGPSHRHDFRDLKMTEFYNMARCCTVLGVGDHTLNPKAHKVTLVKYSDRVRALLNSEIVTVR